MKSTSNARRGLTTFLREPANLLSALILLVVCIAALWPTAWLPHDPTVQDLRARLIPPAWIEGGSLEHLLGTDTLGRDVLSRLLVGARLSMIVSVGAIGISAILGITAGLLAGFYGGRIDAIIMRAVDIQLAFPVVILLIAVVGVVGSGITQLIVVLGVEGWAQYARLVRGSTLATRHADYVEAARSIGASDARIIRLEILPNVTSEIIVLTSLGLARLLLLEASLSFLGLGIQPPLTSWGGMLGDARNYLRVGWWILIFPGLAIAITVLAFNFVGDGIRDALDPHRVRAARRRPYHPGAVPEPQGAVRPDGVPTRD